MSIKRSHIIPTSLLTITILSGAALSSTLVSATDNTDIVDEINITVPVSCSLSGTGMTSHNANIVNGTYQADIGSTTLKAFCNDTNGFAIYAAGYTGDDIGTTNSNKLVGTPASIGNIDTGTATSGDTSNWAMKLATDSNATYAITLDNGFGSYSSVPNSYTKVAHRDSGTDIGTTATGASLTSTYAAFMSQTQPAGTYSGQVIYTLVHPASEVPLQPQITEPGYIGYYPNASTAVGSMSDTNGGPVQQLTTEQTEATLLAPNFSRDGYGFAGWNDKFDYTGNYYGPNESITFTAGQYTGTNNGLSLYAVWVESAGTLQSDANTVCSNLTTAPATGTPTMASVSALTDERDNQTYAIAKLADGNCWMIENLRLEAENTRGTVNEALAQGYNKYSGSGTNFGNFIGLADAEDSFSNDTTANSLYSIDGSNDTENINTLNNPQYRIPRYNHINTDSTSTSPTRATSLTKSTTYYITADANIYGYGNYYNWPAAIANTNFYDSSIYTDATGKTSETVGTSICPTGWKLPYGRNTDNGITSGGFYNLGTELYATTSGATNSNKWRSFPNNFVYSGNYTGAAYTRGINSRYWSSTSETYFSDYKAYTMYLTNYQVSPGTSTADRYSGASIRCLLVS